MSEIDLMTICKGLFDEDFAAKLEFEFCDYYEEVSASYNKFKIASFRIDENGLLSIRACNPFRGGEENVQCYDTQGMAANLSNPVTVDALKEFVKDELDFSGVPGKIMEFMGWVSEVCASGRWENDPTWKKNVMLSHRRIVDDKFLADVTFFTQSHSYSIHASYSLIEEEEGFMCGSFWSRLPNAGENFNRGGDLGEGKVDKNSWESIKNVILQIEFLNLEGTPRKDSGSYHI